MNMTYKVTVEPLGVVLDVSTGQTILDAALRAGLPIPHGCSRGICSACKIDVLEGEVDIGNASSFALFDFEIAEKKCLACCAVPHSDLVIEIDIEPEPDATRFPVRDYQGVVTNIIDVSPSIKSIFIVLGDVGLKFQAGQYIHLEIPGMHGPGQCRTFSIASPPSSPDVIELNVARIDGGEGTAYLHNELSVGDVLSFSGPYGQFFMRQSMPEPIIFLAGGSGLSGVKSMVMELMEKNDPRDITLIYGARTQGELYYRELFEQYARTHSNFTFLSSVDSANSLQCTYREWDCIEELALEHFDGVFEGYNAYVCGAPAMVDNYVSVLIRGRCFERHQFVEKFYTNNGRQA